jgi:predicted nucleic acid-binding protein
MRKRNVTLSMPADLIRRAIDFHEKHEYAFRDSLVIQSAIEGGARRLFSEDFRDGQGIGDLTIRNPHLHE